MATFHFEEKALSENLLVMSIAIVIVTFNRPKSLKRLLGSIKQANFSGYSNINLILSIDFGGGEEMSRIAHEFNWGHGLKTTLTQKTNLGLRKHIIMCGDLTATYGNVLILEDDCVVGPNFYDYASQSLKFYRDDYKIAGISLYSYQINENAQLPFNPLLDGFSAYFAQVPSSLGQLWTEKQWGAFKAFYATNPVVGKSDKIPEKTKEWPESSWKKYFYKYMVEKDLFFVYPYVSHLSNFGDKGTHFDQTTNVFQVPLETRKHSVNYSFTSFSNGRNKYDAYLDLLPECFSYHGIDLPLGTGIDLSGIKQLNLFDYEFLYSIKECTNPIRSYGIEMAPLVQNILFKIPGDNIRFGCKNHFIENVEENKLSIIKNFQPIGYSFGFESGCNFTKNSIVTSKAYRVGYDVLHPINLIKKLFTRIFKRGLSKNGLS